MVQSSGVSDRPGSWEGRRANRMGSGSGGETVVLRGISAARKALRDVGAR